MPTTFIADAKPTTIFLATCAKCVRPWRVEKHDGRHGSKINGLCPDCLSPITYDRLMAVTKRMDCTGACMGAYGPSCTCSCGGINHGAVWSETGEMLESALEKYRAEIAKREAVANAKRDAKARKALAEWNAWVEENREAYEFLMSEDWLSLDRPDGFLADLREQVESHKMLSERQTQSALRNKDRRIKWAKENARREANVTDVPTGRQELAGTIVGIKRVQDDYSYYGGDIIKMIVDCGTFRVYGTAPSALLLGIREREIAKRIEYTADDSPKGYQITFRATVSAGREKGFGFFKRPSNVEITGHTN